ncbi:Putative ribonuclease H protein At1g65750, partial [Linum perenne]
GKQFIHAKGVSREGSVFFLTAVYASPKATERVLLWDVLKMVAGSMTDPWAVVGDFNSILTANDKRGGAGFVRAQNKSFIDTVDLCGLSDLPFQGPKFTWAMNNVLVRLDRALVNDRWLTLFPESRVLHLHKLKSDHRPILLRSNNQVYSPYTKPFRFLSAWLTHPSFKFVLERKWCRGTDLPLALNNLTIDLRHWNNFVFGNIFRRKRRLTEELKKAEARSSSFPSSSNLAEERAIRSKLETVLWQEDALWIQKSRSKWISDGDKNTSYFHLSTLRIRAFNRISRLKDSEGCWITGQPELLSLAINYFKLIYCSRDRWVDSGVVLVDHALDIRRVEGSLLVSQVCSEPGVWNVDFLLHVLPYNIAMQVVGMTPPSCTLGKDSIVWGLEPNGAFSVRSAYLMITDNAATSSDSVWRHIWGWNGPNRIKHFLWLASHKKLLTNEERGRRHLTNQVWGIVLPHAILARNAHRDFDSWWRAMLSNKDCSTQFGIIAWNLWGARNKLIFKESNRSTFEVSEQCLVRDDGGRFIRAFIANIGDCSITRAELSAIVQGLRMAWSMGIRRIIVQSDSQIAISLLHRAEKDHQHASLISEFLELKARSWDIRIDHVYREANFGADYLANLGHSCNFGLHFLFHPDPILAQWL